jgi:histidinol-phosphate aminotransferase
MSHFHLERAIRANILSLQPYRCARDDYQDGILLDANENALGHSIATSSEDVAESELLNADLHRYPDPIHPELKTRIAQLRSIPGADHVFLGVGSDEVIDLLMRITCTPGAQGDAILITPPTYGMYAVCAQINDVRVLRVNLNPDFSLDLPKVMPIITILCPNHLSHVVLRSKRRYRLIRKPNSSSCAHRGIPQVPASH